MWEVLFARTSVFKSMSRTFNGQGASSDNTFLYISFAMIAAFWGVLYYWDKWRKQRSKRTGSAKSLFMELCDAHRLARTERALLMKAAKSLGAGEPAVLFVDPRIVGKFAAASGGEAKQYAALSSKLFSG